MKEDTKDMAFKIIQSFLKNPPLVIWGSGATIPFGMPSMSDLNDILKAKITDFNNSNNNLEEELGKEEYKSNLPEIRKTIWDKVKEADCKIPEQLICNTQIFDGIKKLVEKLIDSHPKVANVITTNYDCVLEYTLDYNGISFTDGFNGRELSSFDENLFMDKNIVNIVKVHGSLNWFNVKGDARILVATTNQSPLIIPPGKNKYQEAYNMPYRELIQKSDSLIKVANSLLAVGFGFNDEHLTPEIKKKINNNTPIVLITKKVTDAAKTELKGATKYVLIEEENDNKSKITYRDLNVEQIITIEGGYWQLTKFMEII